MKIVILQGAFLPVPTLLGGAVEKMWFALGKQFVKTGHEVIQISRTFEGLPKKEIIDGVLHKRIKGYNTPSSGIYLKWLDFLFTRKAISVIPKDADIIVTNTFWAPILITGKQKGKCYVDVQRMPKGQMKLYTKTGRLRANSTSVVNAIKQELEQTYYEKIKMIPNPIPFIPDAKTTYTKQKTILYTGRLHPEKGLEILLKAYIQLPLSNEGWNLKIVGPWQTSAGGGGEEYFQQLKSLASTDSSIDFTGPVYDNEILNSYYKTAAVFVYPSVAEKGETFGIAPLEAMAWGCVPVVSALECFQDFIKHGWNGLIFNHRQENPAKSLAEHLQKLTSDSTLTHELSKNTLDVRQSHSISNIASLFIQDFNFIASEK